MGFRPLNVWIYNATFVTNMKTVYHISYWVVAIILVAGVLTSLGYRFSEALFIGTTFLPGALAVRYFYPKAKADDRKTTIKNIIFLTLGLIISQIFIILLAHVFINNMREDIKYFFLSPELPEMLMNPIFIAIMTAAITLGYHFLEQQLERKYPQEHSPVTFLSDRKPVTLKMEEIIYIESNDSITIVYATDDRRFRNKTSISQWEANLGTQFIRIHRSYLVNKSAVTDKDTDTVYVGETELPVSRKYKDSVHNL